MRERYFAGTNFKPRKLLENAATPTRRVHAVLGSALFFADSPLSLPENGAIAHPFVVGSNLF